MVEKNYMEVSDDHFQNEFLSDVEHVTHIRYTNNI